MGWYDGDYDDDRTRLLLSRVTVTSYFTKPTVVGNLTSLVTRFSWTRKIGCCFLSLKDLSSLVSYSNPVMFGGSYLVRRVFNPRLGTEGFLEVFSSVSSLGWNMVSFLEFSSLSYFPFFEVCFLSLTFLTSL